MTNRVALVVFIAIVLGGGLLIGSMTLPGPWYESLQKPWFNPPNWIFAPVWSVLYVLIGIAGWRVWRLDAKGPLLKIWIVQLLLNFAWTPVYFGAQRIDLALIVVLAMLVLILVFIALAWRRDRVAAWLFIPYAVWVAFASFLNAALFALN